MHPKYFRSGHIAEAIEKCELEHNIKPYDFHLVSADIERDVRRLCSMLHLDRKEKPLILCRAADYDRVKSSTMFLDYRTSGTLKPDVKQFETFVKLLIEHSDNLPPSESQITRLMFEPKFDFVEGIRCQFHSLTDKTSCAIGVARKSIYVMMELLYDCYEFNLLEKTHKPKNFENAQIFSTCASSSMFHDYSILLYNCIYE